MEWDRFWGLVGVLHGSVDEKAIDRLIAEVAEYSTSEIESFDDRLHEAVHALDGPAWFTQPVTDPSLTAAELQAFLAELEAGRGDDALRTDGFLFARAAVVAAGRKTYEQVLAEPALFAASGTRGRSGCSSSRSAPTSSARTTTTAMCRRSTSRPDPTPRCGLDARTSNIRTSG